MRIFKKTGRCVEFHHASMVHDEHSIGINDSLNTMSNGNHSHISTCSTNGFLNATIGVDINVSGCFVQAENLWYTCVMKGMNRETSHAYLCLAKQCTSQTEELRSEREECIRWCSKLLFLPASDRRRSFGHVLLRWNRDHCLEIEGNRTEVRHRCGLPRFSTRLRRSHFSRTVWISSSL